MSTIKWLVLGFLRRVKEKIYTIVNVFRKDGIISSYFCTVKIIFSTLNRYFNLKHRQFDVPILSNIIDKNKRNTQAIAVKYTRHLDNTVERMGNYACDKNLNSSSTIYSFGISNDIDFEKELIRLKGCKVYAYDPTPSSKKYILNEIKQYNLENKLIFEQKGLWTEDGIFKFYSVSNTSDEGSLTNLNQSNSFYEIECHKLETFMRENGNDSIDLLKMDIEGAAIKVMRSWIDSGAYLPNSISCEIEHPDNDDSWFEEVSNILSDFQKLNYEIFFLSRRVQFRDLELFLRKTL